MRHIYRCAQYARAWLVFDRRWIAAFTWPLTNANTNTHRWRTGDIRPVQVRRLCIYGRPWKLTYTRFIMLRTLANPAIYLLLHVIIDQTELRIPHSVAPQLNCYLTTRIMRYCPLDANVGRTHFILNFILRWPPVTSLLSRHKRSLPPFQNTKSCFATKLKFVATILFSEIKKQVRYNVSVS